mmetsp:Transcript_5824/g.14891  ORF Transcript_5824/g.14891 Transcript_5824/m.14891 type:complete len:392 (+) Transcript_5824:523-1698(+)
MAVSVPPKRHDRIQAHVPFNVHIALAERPGRAPLHGGLLLAGRRRASGRILVPQRSGRRGSRGICAPKSQALQDGLPSPGERACQRHHLVLGHAPRPTTRRARHERREFAVRLGARGARQQAAAEPARARVRRSHPGVLWGELGPERAAERLDQPHRHPPGLPGPTERRRQRADEELGHVGAAAFRRSPQRDCWGECKWAHHHVGHQEAKPGDALLGSSELVHPLQPRALPAGRVAPCGRRSGQLRQSVEHPHRPAPRDARAVCKRDAMLHVRVQRLGRDGRPLLRRRERGVNPGATRILVGRALLRTSGGKSIVQGRSTMWGTSTRATAQPTVTAKSGKHSGKLSYGTIKYTKNTAAPSPDSTFSEVVVNCWLSLHDFIGIQLEGRNALH